jgi:tyrosine-specific transport protein
VCFGYQNLIPTLTYYVKRNVAAIRSAIFVGNLIPFLIYFVWNFVILGILPDGNSIALAQIVSQSDMVTGLLEKASEYSYYLLYTILETCT